MGKSLSTGKVSGLLKPSVVFCIVTVSQFLFWVISEPSGLGIQGVSDKFVSFIALFRYCILNLIMFLMLRAAEKYSDIKVFTKAEHNQSRLDMLLLVVFSAYFIGIISSLWPIIDNFEQLLSAVANSHTISAIVYSAQDNLVTESLSNLGPVVASLSFYLLLHDPECGARKINKYSACIIVILLASVLESFLLSRRLQIIIIILALGITYLIVRKISISIKKIIAVFAVLFILVICFELSRSGSTYAASHHIPVYSIENIVHTIQYLLSAYLFSDVNNAMVIMNSPSDVTLVYGGVDFVQDALWGLFGIDESNLSFSFDWTSKYGTINAMGMWWISFGWFSIIPIAIISLFAGTLWKGICSAESPNFFLVAMYALVVIGLILDFRINFFVLTKFLVPAITLLLSYLLMCDSQKIKVNRRVRNED